jgi:hypothetical protein
VPEEHDVEVALGAELRSAVAADRDQGHTLEVVARDVGEERRQPFVDQLAVPAAPKRAREGAVGEERGTWALHRNNGTDCRLCAVMSSDSSQ